MMTETHGVKTHHQLARVFIWIVHRMALTMDQIPLPELVTAIRVYDLAGNVIKHASQMAADSKRLA